MDLDINTNQQINFIENLEGIYLYYYKNRIPDWQHEQMANFHE